MHFQLLELDLLLELLELLLVELCGAALTLLSNSCFRQGISFFHVDLVECPLLLLYYVKVKLFLLDVAHGLGTLGPACAVLAPSLRAARARTRRYVQKRGGKQLQMWTLRGACA